MKAAPLTAAAAGVLVVVAQPLAGSLESPVANQCELPPRMGHWESPSEGKCKTSN